MYQATQRAGVICFLFAMALSATAATTTKLATAAQLDSIRAALKEQFANADTAKFSNVFVGKDTAQPKSNIQHVCGYANTTRFYGTLAIGNDGKPDVTILGTRDIADEMCKEKLGI